MNNLKYPKKQILLNTLSSLDFGLYQKTGGAAQLLFKKEGLTLPGQGTMGGTTLATGFKGSRSFTDAGKHQSVLLTFNPNCPCDECDYDYGIDIFRRVKTPGVNNPYKHKDMRSYGGNIESLQTCVSGKLAAADILTIEEDIMDQITADTGKGVDDGAIVNAYRCYKVTDDATGSNSVITFTWSDGTTTAITGVANAEGQIPLAGNEDTTAMTTGLPLASAVPFNEVIQIYKISTAAAVDTLFIRCMIPGLKYTVTGTTTATVVSRHLLLESKDAENLFDVVTKNDIATQVGVWLLDLQYVSTAADQATTVHVNGSAGTAVTSHATIGTWLTNLNTATTAQGLGNCNSYAATRKYFFTYVEKTTAITDVYFDFRKEQGASALLWSSNTWLSTSATPRGKFPYLTSDDVFQIFANQKHMGDYSNLIYSSNAADGTTWVKYYMKVLHPLEPTMHSASGYAYNYQEIEIYVNSDYIGKYGSHDYWDNTDYMTQTGDSGFTADTNFEEFLEDWVGYEPYDWTL